MQYCSSLYAVRSIEAAKTFYQEVLGQTIILDHGANVTFQGGFAVLGKTSVGSPGTGSSILRARTWTPTPHG